MQHQSVRSPLPERGSENVLDPGFDGSKPSTAKYAVISWHRALVGGSTVLMMNAIDTFAA